MPVLETARLEIRELAPSDLPQVHVLLDDGDPSAKAARRRWLEWTSASYTQLAELKQPPYGDRAIVLRRTGELIGLCGLVPCLGPYAPLLGDSASTRAAPEVGLYWAISAEHRRRGFASEAGQALLLYAFEALHLRRVIATTTFDNAGSIRVMRRIGMQVRLNHRRDPEWLQVVGVIDAAV
jgi:RimJ/RimL family protein N-acetyltransferase